jgi:hypothetical protein
MSNREFVDEVLADVDRAPDEDEVVYIEVAGEETAFHYPGSGQLAYMAMASAGDRNNLTTAGMMINFVISLMEDEDARRLRGLLLDRKNEYGMEDLLDVFDALMEQWSSRPTQSPSDSSTSQQETGRRSTANSRRAGSVRSGSRSARS